MPYGYAIENNQIVIDVQQAAVIRRIFSDYLAGSNMDEIAAALNTEKIPKSKRYPSDKWYRSSVKYILSNGCEIIDQTRKSLIIHRE